MKDLYMEKLILKYLQQYPKSSSRQIQQGVLQQKSIATVKRYLSKLKDKELIISNGKGKSTKYELSPYYHLFNSIDIEKYYEKEIDDREIIVNFNFSLLSDVLPKIELFCLSEKEKLQILQEKFQTNIAKLTDFEKQKEFERLAIDLSWKSSQIEGNTYSLLETEILLKEKGEAKGKSKEETVMLLNHKEAIDFIIENPDYLFPLNIAKIEDIHNILTKNLIIDKNIRKRKVGISGTNYQPLDNEYQIREALLSACKIINNKNSIFERALLALVLISYIQPFTDGNKRTARIISNAILIHHKYCPISFRTISSIDYKKAMLLFYEQNSIKAFKNIFMEQFEFAVKTYF